MRKELLLVSGLLIGSMAFAIDPAEIDSLINLKGVVVSANKIHVNRNSVPLSISVIEREEIEASSESALLPVLSERVPGLFVTEKGITGFGVSEGAAGTVNIRGVGQGNKVLMLFDGQPQWAGIFGHSLPDTYVASDVERVEVIRGPGALLYGSNAMGGVVNIITRQLEPDSGTIEIGETVVYGYYKQDGISFKEDDRPIDIVKNISEKIDLGNGRVMSASQFLEYFLFPDKLQYSLVAKLSGGERRRLYLLTVLMSNPNFLILDEPTNDLDIMTLNVLEDYLKSFQGCLIIVSHDRFFTDKVVDRVFAFEGDGVVKDFPGNYTQYKNKKEEEELLRKQEGKKIPVAPKPVREKEKVRKLTFKEKQEMQQLESDMEKLNTEKTTLETALNSGALDTEELVKSSQRIAEIIDLLDEKEMRWLELSEIE